MMKKLTTTFRILIFGALVLFFIPSAHSKTFQSGDQHIALVELYTSEGCSSCPPAENFLSRLKEHGQVWKDFIPLAFHVTYWDYIGWQDRLADPEYDRRQYRYQKLWKNNVVYTPNLVVSGREWKNWRSARSIPRADGDVGNLSVSELGNDRYQVSFSPITSSDNWTAHISLLGFGVVSDVRSGENRGRVLKHDFVALEYSSAKMSHIGNGLYSVTIDLPNISKEPTESLGIVAWVSQGKSVIPLQTTGGMLN